MQWVPWLLDRQPVFAFASKTIFDDIIHGSPFIIIMIWTMLILLDYIISSDLQWKYAVALKVLLLLCGFSERWLHHSLVSTWYHNHIQFIEHLAWICYNKLPQRNNLDCWRKNQRQTNCWNSEKCFLATFKDQLIRDCFIWAEGWSWNTSRLFCRFVFTTFSFSSGTFHITSYSYITYKLW